MIKDSHWFHFNDSTVSATDWETVSKSKAYILFYIQREFKSAKNEDAQRASSSNANEDSDSDSEE